MPEPCVAAEPPIAVGGGPDIAMIMLGLAVGMLVLAPLCWWLVWQLQHRRPD